MTALLHCIGAHVHSRRGFGTPHRPRLSNHRRDSAGPVISAQIRELGAGLRIQEAPYRRGFMGHEQLRRRPCRGRR